MTSYNNSHNNTFCLSRIFFSPRHQVLANTSSYRAAIVLLQCKIYIIITTCFDISSTKMKRLMQGCSVLFLLAESRRTLQGPAKRQLYRYLLSEGLHNRIEGIRQTQIGRCGCHITSLQHRYKLWLVQG